ncbi:MAG TPA: hypothetical protein VGH89_02880 [Pseudonocardia sp.]|jgi:hypothetical protein
MHPDQYDVGEDAISPLASVLSTMPEVWQRLLEDHVPDASGRCLACRNHGTAGVPWPCTLQVIATDARMIYHTPGELSDPEQCGLAS